MEEWMISGSIGAGVLIYVEGYQILYVYVSRMRQKYRIKASKFLFLRYYSTSWDRNWVKLMKGGDENARDGKLVT